MRFISFPIKQSYSQEYQSDKPMFNLCRKVKIYHTVNHYHSHSTAQESHQIQFQEEPRPEAQMIHSEQNIKMIQSHSLSPKKYRTGIAISLKDSSLSPVKNSQLTHDRNEESNCSHHRTVSNNMAQESEICGLKLRNFHRRVKDFPMIVESKITYGEMSPLAKSKETSEGSSAVVKFEEQINRRPVLKKLTSGTTQYSMENSGGRMESSLNRNPLKRSSSFIKSSSKSKLEETVRQSIENSLNNSIDFRLSTCKTKKQDASESLLKLSCSSYTEILDQPSQRKRLEEFEESCSLELKKEESSFLNEYACQVNESIILSKPVGGLDFNVNKSKDSSLNSNDQIYFKSVYSNILRKQADSPVQKLKKRYGDSLLHPYDKETIVSKSFTSNDNNESRYKEVIDESSIIEHEIQNKFVPIKGSEINRDSFRMFLAIEGSARMMVAIKELPNSCIYQVNKELSIYRQMQSNENDVSISKLYQMFTHQHVFVLVKEPYELTLKEFIHRHSKEYVLISWEFIIKSIEETIARLLSMMKKRRIVLSRLISAEDVVYTFGNWKLHSTDMFEFCSGQSEEVPTGQVLQYLREQIFGHIHSRQSNI